MSVNFNLTSKTKVDVFKDNASVQDVTNYQIDCTAWQEDNDTITSAAWSIESGSASIASEAVTAGVVSARITFNQSGKVLLSVLISTATVKKKIWIEILVRDRDCLADDYGMGT